jgi:hypothetical protein
MTIIPYPQKDRKSFLSVFRTYTETSYDGLSFDRVRMVKDSNPQVVLAPTVFNAATHTNVRPSILVVSSDGHN